MIKVYMRRIIGSSESDCTLMILFQLYGSGAGLFEGDFILNGSVWLSLPLKLYTERTNPIFI